MNQVVRIPWGVPTVSDATKLGLARCAGSNPLAGQRLYELLLQLAVSDDFANLTSWTESDSSGSNVAVSGGILYMNGSNAWAANGVYLTAGIARALTEITLKAKLYNSTSTQFSWGLHSSAALPTSSSNQAYGAFRQPNAANTLNALLSSVIQKTRSLTANTTYNLRLRMDPDEAGAFTRCSFWIKGGSEFSDWTMVADSWIQAELAATVYPFIQRYSNTGASLAEFSEFRVYQGFATDGPTLTYVADAGKIFGVSSAGTMVAADLEDPEAAVTGAVSFTGGATGVLRSYNATTGKANIHTISGVPQAGTVTCTATGHSFTISDVGVQAYFQGFDFTRFKAVAGWSVTNAKFQYSVDGGAASGFKTLAQLQAVGNLGVCARVVFDVQANSDGAVQQYVGEANSLDATEGIGDFPAVAAVLTSDTVQGVAGSAVTKDLTFSEEADRNTVPDLTKIPTEATGGPAAWLQLNVSRAGSLDLDAAKLAFEAARNNDNGTVAAQIIAPATVKIRNVTITGTGSSGSGAPSAPTWGDTPVTPGNGQLALSVVAPSGSPSAVIYARWKTKGATAWEGESETFKRTGTGAITITGLTNGQPYVVSGYVKAGSLESEWLPALEYTPKTAGVCTPEEALRALLLANADFAALVGSRVYPQSAPQKTAWPYVVYQRVDTEPMHHMVAASGLNFVRVQLELYASTWAECKELAEAARMAADGYRGTVTDASGASLSVKIRRASDGDSFSEPIAGRERVAHRVVQDYMVSHRETVPAFS